MTVMKVLNASKITLIRFSCLFVSYFEKRSGGVSSFL